MTFHGSGHMTSMVQGAHELHGSGHMAVPNDEHSMGTRRNLPWAPSHNHMRLKHPAAQIGPFPPPFTCAVGKPAGSDPPGYLRGTAHRATCTTTQAAQGMRRSWNVIRSARAQPLHAGQPLRR